MNTRHKVKKLQELMQEQGLAAYIVTSSNPHQSEYMTASWQTRRWVSGFTGSAGTLVITADEVGLWTDGRYFIQAARELEDTGIKLFRMGMPDVPTFPDWLCNILTSGDRVALDGAAVSQSMVCELANKFKGKELTLVSDIDLVGKIWFDRPELPLSEVFLHPFEFTGASRLEKIAAIRQKMEERGAAYLLVAALDEIAWMFNIRGKDIPNNPLTIAFAFLSHNDVFLFIDERKIGSAARKVLQNDSVTLLPYEKIASFLTHVPDNGPIMLSEKSTSAKLYAAIPDSCTIMDRPSMIAEMKAIKNDTEISNFRNCMISDGTAMVKFLYWLDTTIGKERITEITAAKKLSELRATQKHSHGDSFETTAAFGEHAAMMHYSATPAIEYELKREGFFLIDSGGQYLNGTTDITRTVALGPLTDEERHDFTLVLKAHINLAEAIFLEGTTGAHLDILCREPLWKEGLDYKCGTGHGVGYFLSVHEGPQSISQAMLKVPLKCGMITTNEPGIYKEGKYGIRTENMMLTTQHQITEFGTFFRFETLTLCPIDIRAIVPDMLDQRQKDWLNSYHTRVYEKLGPHLNTEERVWLGQKTAPI